jgi:hypothetical protein
VLLLLGTEADDGASSESDAELSPSRRADLYADAMLSKRCVVDDVCTVSQSTRITDRKYFVLQLQRCGEILVQT